MCLSTSHTGDPVYIDPAVSVYFTSGLNKRGRLNIHYLHCYNTKAYPTEPCHLQSTSYLCTSLPSFTVFFFFLFSSLVWVIEQRGPLSPTCPTKAACGLGKRPALLSSSCWESRGGMSFHASSTTSLNSSADLFHYVNESFYYFRDL